MFFGSGNLVFPLQVGFTSANHWLIGFFGFFCTGIILPFLGLFVIKLHKGSYNKFFGEAGKVAEFAIPFFTLSLLGAFGVIPRCITVAHGGLEYLFPDISLLVFSVIFCAICFFACLNEKLMFSALGKILTPILLVFLLILIVVGISKAPGISDMTDISPYDSFISGFFQGYDTMDLFAAFFFSALIFKQIESLIGVDDEKTIIKAALKPSFIGAALLGLVYLGFVYLGSHYTIITKGVAPELMLPTIAIHVLGKNGALFIAIIIIFSCLTTAVALNGIYAKYLCSFNIIGGQRFTLVLLINTILSFTISLLDFNGIAAILGPLLAISYPALIALTILSICIKGKKTLKMSVFYGIITLMLVL
jgi:LIVCS family branched-chain amino acid:cation transporter